MLQFWSKISLERQYILFKIPNIPKTKFYSSIDGTWPFNEPICGREDKIKMDEIQLNCDDMHLIQNPNPSPDLVVLNLRNLFRYRFFSFSLFFISYYRKNWTKETLYCICQAFCLCFSSTIWRYCCRAPITTNRPTLEKFRRFNVRCYGLCVEKWSQ